MGVNLPYSLFLPVYCTASAQKEVSAKSIIDVINKGQTVNFDGVTITGELDITELANKKRVKKNKNDSEEYKSYVEVPISFKNCVFRDDFIAYKNLEIITRARSLAEKIVTGVLVVGTIQLISRKM